MKEALALIEKVYGISLNPNESYFLQLHEALASSGDLSNKVRQNEVLFEMAQIIDKLEARIKALEDDRIEIANQINVLQKADNPSIQSSTPDPTQPLDAVSSPEATTE